MPFTQKEDIFPGLVYLRVGSGNEDGRLWTSLQEAQTLFMYITDVDFVVDQCFFLQTEHQRLLLVLLVENHDFEVEGEFLQEFEEIGPFDLALLGPGRGQSVKQDFGSIQNQGIFEVGGEGRKRVVFDVEKVEVELLEHGLVSVKHQSVVGLCELVDFHLLSEGDLLERRDFLKKGEGELLNLVEVSSDVFWGELEVEEIRVFGTDFIFHEVEEVSLGLSLDTLLQRQAHHI